jgi:hypothetical protein
MNRVLLLLLACGTLVGFSVVFADAKSGSITVSGWVTKIDLSAGTFAIRNRKEPVQFTIDPSRTDIQVDGSVPQHSVSSVRVGAAALVKLSWSGDHLIVKSVKFTHRPATAIPVKSRPGFVFSPYSHVLFDVERCAHGDMLVDAVGKIFLVP